MDVLLLQYQEKKGMQEYAFTRRIALRLRGMHTKAEFGTDLHLKMREEMNQTSHGLRNM